MVGFYWCGSFSVATSQSSDCIYYHQLMFKHYTVGKIIPLNIKKLIKTKNQLNIFLLFGTKWSLYKSQKMTLNSVKFYFKVVLYCKMIKTKNNQLISDLFHGMNLYIYYTLISVFFSCCYLSYKYELA